MKKVGIIGSGIVGKTLAAGAISHGYEAMIASRDTSKLEEWHQDNSSVQLGSVDDAAQFGDIVIFAVKGTVAKEALEGIDSNYLKGKTVIDATNPIDTSAPDNGVLRFFSSINRSLMEELQEAQPEANFVKAFNSIGSAFMVDPQFEGGKPTMFIAGNSDEAKEEVREMLLKFGHDIEDMGGVEGARAIEPLCMLWCIPGFRENRWSHAFKLLK
ncbi:NADPH-dependent F420 reductase [Sanyastnella coralliicola]|uniref:NADPH-dependent F420 reductase n=1 Tax=Sanyastnella coralliicola TaxID=3069118 RepID=UPI0027B9A8F8|nr:NAD(P)-binding domain-containing protein [Longitalea sp. SCSIO 12813]